MYRFYFVTHIGHHIHENFKYWIVDIVFKKHKAVVQDHRNYNISLFDWCLCLEIGMFEIFKNYSNKSVRRRNTVDSTWFARHNWADIMLIGLRDYDLLLG